MRYLFDAKKLYPALYAWQLFKMVDSLWHYENTAMLAQPMMWDWGQDYLFIQPMVDDRSVGETWLFHIIIYAIPFDDASRKKLYLNPKILKWID